MTMGPVQVLVVGFDDPDFRGEILAEIERLLTGRHRADDRCHRREEDRGRRARDVLAEDVEASAEFGALAGALIGIGAGGEEAAEIAAVRGAEAAVSSDLLDDQEVWYIADAIPNGSAAAIALLEHRWAIGLREAIGRAGGFHLADAWIHPRDLVAIGVAAAEETAESR